MTIQDFILDTRRKIEEITRDNKPLQIAALTTNQVRAKRIFLENRLVNGSLIGGGKYGGGPLYVNPDKAPRAFPRKGKTGQSKFKDGKSHKTGYFANYAAYKKELGRLDQGRVNLFLSGDLRSDFMNSRQTNLNINASKPIKVNVNEYIESISGENIEIKKGLTKKYGDIFGVSEAEKDIFYQTAEDELRRLYDS